MAPDLSNVTRPLRTTSTTSNSASPAQASPSLSRRTSSAMAPPPVPQNSSIPNSPRPPTVAMDTSGYGGTTGKDIQEVLRHRMLSSSGPIRHPRPLTAAELHLELEKEQESIVNRLTRELSALRAQTASVASTTSSTSDLFTTNQSDSHLYTYQFGITPTPARRHRSSSNLSSRSARSARDTLANSASVTSVSGVAAPRERDRERDNNAIHSHQASSRPSMELPRPDMSRQNSSSGVYRSTSYNNSHSNTQQHQQPLSASTTSPAVWTQPHNSSRHSMSSTYSNIGQQPVSETNYTRSPSSNTALASSRYEEAAIQRQELEAVKRENEALKMRIRELERSLSGQGPGNSTSGSGLNIHSSSNSTTTSGGGSAVTVNGTNAISETPRISS